jgi:heme-degrading monooxygenase HmoA
MILEVAILDVKNGLDIDSEKDFALASQYISATDGYQGHSLRKCLERANRYILLVNWKDLKSHEIGFRKSHAYQKWKALLHKYYNPFPIVEHYKTGFENNI